MRLDADGLFHALDMIVNERIFLSTCDPMNDPEEGNWQLPDVRSEGWLNLCKRLRELVDSQRFTCFVDDCNNPLMWAHYAGGFSGIAFEYEIDERIHDLREVDCVGVPIVSEIQINEVLAGKLRPQDIGILKQKNNYWGYEKEWRFYGNNSDKYLENIRPQGVILGSKANKYDDVLKKISRRLGVRVGYITPGDGINLVVEYVGT